MFDCFLAQMLVLILIAVCSSRIFFLKKARVDCFAAFSPVALFVSICIFFCFDFLPLSFLVFLLALFVFFVNFRSVLRLSARLFVDTYSVVFIISTVISLILTIALGALIVIFRPVRYTEKDFNVTRRQITLTGPCTNLRVHGGALSGERATGTLFVYEPLVHDEIVAEIYKDNPVLIFATGVRATVQNYESYLMLLAQKGYTVLAADLYTDDLKLLSQNAKSTLAKAFLDSPFLRRFAAIQFEKLRPAEFEELLAQERLYATKKYSALTKCALELFGDDVKTFYIVDGIDFDSIYAVVDEFNTEPYANAKGFFSMNRVPEYETSGYGFIEQTDVLLAYQKGIARENKFFIPRYVANKTIKAIEEQK